MPQSNPFNIPGFEAMGDTFEFARKAWGNMKITGMPMPTLSVDEIQKQIKDLKTVEAWLTLNMNMLRGTIQALEVQAATIATLQAMSEAMQAMGRPDGGGSARSSDNEQEGERTGDARNTSEQTATQAPFAAAAAWWNLLQEQFNQAVDSAVKPQPEAAAGPAAEKKPAAKKSGGSRKRPDRRPAT